MFSVFQQASTKRFNPRTREGATIEYENRKKEEEVSIHAPVRVRRRKAVSVGAYLHVSIHAPVRVRRRKGICVQS